MKKLLEKITDNLDYEITGTEYTMIREYLTGFQRDERLILVANLRRVELVEELLSDTLELLDCYVLLQQMNFDVGDKIYKVLKDSEDNELIVKYFDRIKFTYLKKNLLYLIQEDELLIKGVINSSKDDDKFLAADLLEKDEYKVISLKYVQDMNLKTKIICSIQDEVIRANELMLLPIRFRRKVCKTFTDDKILRDLYEKNIDYFFSAEILCLINDDELKKRMINNYSISSHVDIINSLDDENNIMEIIWDNMYDHYCDCFVKRLSEDNLIKYFNKITELNGKIKIINKIEDTNVKKKLIYSLKNVEFRRNLLGNLVNDKERILEDTKVPYIPYDVDGKITIGIELEVCCDNPKIYLTLKKLLCDWDIKIDRTVEDGIEITSPILHYDRNSMRELKYICDFLKYNNFYINDTCGGHIHLGFDYFDNSDEFRVFLNLYQSVEKILYLITNRACTELRSGAEVYAKQLSPVIDKVKKLNVNWDKIDNLSECVSLIKNNCETRYYALNLSNALDKKNTLEFRMANGELEFAEIILNIRLFTKMIETAKKIAKIIYKDNLSNEEISMLKLYKCLISDVSNDRKKLKLLLDLLFNDFERKEYMVRYRKNSMIKRR